MEMHVECEGNRSQGYLRGVILNHSSEGDAI